MDVGVSELRAQLSEWLDRARAGEEIVITERGQPVARLVGLTHAPLLERLVAEGVVSRPDATARPKASGRSRPRAGSSLAGIVSDQRR